MYEIIRKDELTHHGILGQKWGHRNGPPYPLGASDHSAAEKAAMNSGSSSKSGSGSDSNASSKSKTSSSSNVESGKTFVNGQKEGWSDLDSDAQIALIELGVMTAAVAASAISTKIYKNKEIKRLDAKIDTMYRKREVKSLKDLQKLEEKSSPKENMKEVNPDFPDKGTTSNCMLCTTAMIMREKGYKVKANKIDEGLFEENMKRAFDGSEGFKKLKARDTNQIFDKLAKEGEGAYGNLTVQFWVGGGHSVFWKVENGKTHIYDGQSGEEYKKRDSKLMPYVNPQFCMYERYDNLEPTEYVLAFVH